MVGRMRIPVTINGNPCRKALHLIIGLLPGTGLIIRHFCLGCMNYVALPCYWSSSATPGVAFTREMHFLLFPVAFPRKSWDAVEPFGHAGLSCHKSFHELPRANSHSLGSGCLYHFDGGDLFC